MKKYFVIALLASVFIIPSVSFAAISDAGLLPDSSLYFLKSWKESIQLFFTFNAENKAKQYLHLAEVRLAEYQKMLEKGKDDIAEKTLKKYQDQLNRALSKAEEIKQKGKDIKDLSQQIEEAVSKHLEVLQENLAKVPEQAKKGIETAIENSQKGSEKFLEMKINKEEENDEEKREELKENNETSDWKTYRNEKYGFEVKYPNDWELFGSNMDSFINIASYNIYNPKFERGNVDGIKIQIQSEQFNNKVYLDDFVPKQDELTGNIIKVQKININNYEARKIDNMGVSMIYYLTNDNIGFRILIFHPIPNSFNKIINQILSTFKFIK